jgi:DinB superfamily
MNTQSALRNSLGMGEMVGMAYLGDLTDAEFMQRPHPKCNHINFQVCHLIVSEHELMSKVGSMPGLPEGFAAKYAKENATCDDPSKFATKDQLIAAYKAQRAATLTILDKIQDSELSDATGVSYAPTKCEMIAMQGAHWLMHAGQWVVVRRQNDKPVVI